MILAFSFRFLFQWIIMRFKLNESLVLMNEYTVKFYFKPLTTLLEKKLKCCSEYDNNELRIAFRN